MNQGREGHGALALWSVPFERQPPLARHRMVYAALGEMMQTDIHALTITALTPDET